MCGRYRRTTQEEELARLYHIPIPRQTDLPISYNIVPSQKVLTIRFNPETRQRSLDALQWGLIPYWAKDPKIAYKTINCTRGNGRYGTFVPAGLQKTALPDSSGRILRMEEGRRRQSFFRFPEGNRFDAPELQVR